MIVQVNEQEYAKRVEEDTAFLSKMMPTEMAILSPTPSLFVRDRQLAVSKPQMGTMGPMFRLTMDRCRLCASSQAFYSPMAFQVVDRRYTPAVISS